MAQLKRRVVIRRSKARTPARQTDLGEHLRVTLIGVGFLFGALILGTTLWLWRTGWIEKKSDAVAENLLGLTRRAGFAVNDVLVEGRGQTDRDEILRVLGLQKGTAILGFNPHEALDKLKDIPWVKSGVVERRLPSTVFVRLTEREPIAIWQFEKKLKLIDREGHVLRDVSHDENIALPLVVGKGADKHAAALLGLLVTYPSLLSATKAASRISDRRWDLLMAANIVVKLPEENLEAALQQLNKMVQEQDILSRTILGLDLRNPDRMIVETDKEIDPPKTAPKVTPPQM